MILVILRVVVDGVVVVKVEVTVGVVVVGKTLVKLSQRVTSS